MFAQDPSAGIDIGQWVAAVPAKRDFDMSVTLFQRVADMQCVTSEKGTDRQALAAGFLHFTD